MANTYYVSQVDGNDGYDGLYETWEGGTNGPWLTVAKVSGVTFSAGDTIKFKCGGQWTGLTDPLQLNDSGDSENPITVTSYGTGAKPMISNPSEEAGKKMCINITADYNIVDGLDLNGTCLIAPGAGVYCSSVADYNIVRNCDIWDCRIGVEFDGTHNLATNNYIHDLDMDQTSSAGAMGVVVKAADNEVSYNTFVNCRHVSEAYGYDGGAIESYGICHRLYIHHNFAYQNEGFIEFGAASGNPTVSDVRIEYNIMLNTGRFTGIHMDGGSWSITPDNFKMQNNTLIETSASPIETKVAYLVFDDSGSAGQYIFRNNIVVLDGWTRLCSTVWTTWDHDHNDYYMLGGTSLNITPDATDITDNPQLINYGGTSPADYRISASSPCIDKGTNVSLTLDYFGNTVPIGSNPDMGAHESGDKIGLLWTK